MRSEASLFAGLRIFFGAVVLGSSLLAPFGRPAAAAPAAGEKELRWGGDSEGGAPFVEADPNDPEKLRGFDVEIAAEIARGLGRKPRFVQVAFTSIDASAERGDFEIGMSGVEDTPARRGALSATVPYFEFREVLTVRQADAATYRSLADLKGRRVGTLSGTIAYEVLEKAAATHGVQLVSYDDDVHPYSDLAEGRLEAVLLDHIIAARAMARVPGLATNPEAITRGCYIGVLARRNAALRDRIDEILKSRMKDGTLERIFRRWNVWDEEQAKLFARVSTESGTALSVSGAGPGGNAGAPVAAAGAGFSPVSVASSESRPPGVTLAAVRRYLPALLSASVVTIVLSCLAMALAVALGVLIASGRVYGNAPVRALLTGYVELMRGTPVLLQLFVLYYGLASVVRLPAFAAALLGLGLNYAAYESEIYRGALQAVSKGQLEAARTLGLTERQILTLVRGPQAFRLALAPMTNDFVALLKDSSLVSVITVIELTKETSIFAANIGSWAVPGALCAALYLLLSLPLSRLAVRLERRWRAETAS